MANKRKYGPNSRAEMEQNESQPTVSTDMPTTRFQGDAQVPSSMSNVTKASIAGNTKADIVVNSAEKIRDKVKVKPSADADLVDPKSVGGLGTGISGAQVTGAALMSAAGAVNASAGQDASRIPYTSGGQRPEGRFDRKLSDNDFLINNEICEIIDPQFEGTKPLSESGDKKQGYFGRKQFSQARGKKNAGSRPQATMFDRSADFIHHDEMVHLTGQVIDTNQQVVLTIDGENSVVKGNYPTVRALPNTDSSLSDGYEDVTDPMVKSNYVLKSMKLTINGGKLTGIRFNEDRVDAHATAADAEQANVNWQIDRNNVVNSVIKLQTELGRETTDKWSPLGYVVEQPYEYNELAHDIEATTGAIMGAAYRFGNSSLAFNFKNKLKKDGANATYPAVDMFVNGMGYTASDTIVKTYLEQCKSMNAAIFNKAMYRKGSAAAIIAMFDTTRKYKTKAAFANYQKSLKFFLQTMDNNINPLHCKPEFLAALDTAHTYSTVDGTYNPMLPIYATRKVSIVSPLSFDFFAKGFDRTKVGASKSSGYDEWGVKYQYAYKYDDLRNVYYWGISHPIVSGLVRWMLNHEAALAETFGDGEVEMSCAFDAMYPTLFAFMLAAAAQDIVYVRAVTFRDFLFAGEQTEYIWPDLKPLSELNFKSSSNFTMSSYNDPIVMGKLKPASAIRMFWGEQYVLLASDNPAVGTQSADFLMPWYHCENSFTNDYTHTRGFLSDKPNTMCFPEVRHGVSHDYIDLIFGIEERDVRLCLDRAVTLPYHHASKDLGLGTWYYDLDLDSGALTHAISATSIKNGMKIASLRYDSNSDGRVVVHYANEAAGGNDSALLCKADVLSIPRELGYLYPSFRCGAIFASITPETNDNQDVTAITFEEVGNYRLSTVLDGSMGYDVTSYSALGSGIYDSEVIDRQVALQQKYCRFFADRSSEVVDINSTFADVVGILPSISALFDAGATELSGDAVIDASEAIRGLGTNTAPNGFLAPGFISLSKYTWSVLNRFFIPCNPFENCLHAGGSNAQTNNRVPCIDPFETAFMFGLCGFFASDFTEDVYQRSEHILELGQFYVEDDYLKSSLIMRAD